MAIKKILAVDDSATGHHVIRQGVQYCAAMPIEAAGLPGRIAAPA